MVTVVGIVVTILAFVTFDVEEVFEVSIDAVADTPGTTPNVIDDLVRIIGWTIVTFYNCNVGKRNPLPVKLNLPRSCIITMLE